MTRPSEPLGPTGAGPRPPGRAPIVQERRIGVPVGRVFAAWADPALLGRWMCPGAGFRPATVDLDFRPGGRFRIVMHGDRDYTQTGHYLEIVPEQRIVLQWESDFVPPEDAVTRVTVHFHDEGDATRLVLVHDRLPDSGSYDGHEAGWASILDGVSAVLSGGI